jgi:hypothetical protein
MANTNNKGVIPEKWLTGANKYYLSRFEVELSSPLEHGLVEEQKDIIISSSPENARGSPRPARAGGNLVGRGIANPMSERTRGFELPRNGTKFPLPALLVFPIFSKI